MKTSELPISICCSFYQRKGLKGEKKGRERLGTGSRHEVAQMHLPCSPSLLSVAVQGKREAQAAGWHMVSPGPLWFPTAIREGGWGLSLPARELDEHCRKNSVRHILLLGERAKSSEMLLLFFPSNFTLSAPGGGRAPSQFSNFHPFISPFSQSADLSSTSVLSTAADTGYKRQRLQFTI